MTATMQAVPGQKPAEDALGNLAGQGILGSLCVLLIVAVFLSIRALLREKDRRFSDQEKLLEVVKQHNENAKNLVVEVTKSQAAAENTLSNQVNALTTVQTTLATQATSLNNLSQAVSRLEGAKS